MYYVLAWNSVISWSTTFGWRLFQIKYIDISIYKLSNKKSILSGIKADPFFDFILVKRMVIPLLYILLRIGNKLWKYFNIYISERLELLQPNKVEAINNTILSQIELEKYKEKWLF